jgi:hypothetical protein
MPDPRSSLSRDGNTRCYNRGLDIFITRCHPIRDCHTLSPGFRGDEGEILNSVDDRPGNLAPTIDAARVCMLTCLTAEAMSSGIVLLPSYAECPGVRH